MPRIPAPDKPNVFEVTGTTLPLLSTVLAGFAVTIVVQLFTRSEAKEPWTAANREFGVALACLAVAVLLYLTATTFAVWGQGYKYIHLTDEVRKIWDAPASGWDNYLIKVHARWLRWHRAAVSMFYAGTIVFVLGTGLLLRKFIGPCTSNVFFFLIAASLLCAVLLAYR